MESQKMSWADETSVTVEISKSRKFDRFVEALVWSSRKYRSLNGRQLRDFVCQIFGMLNLQEKLVYV